MKYLTLLFILPLCTPEPLRATAALPSPVEERQAPLTLETLERRFPTTLEVGLPDNSWEWSVGDCLLWVDSCHHTLREDKRRYIKIMLAHYEIDGPALLTLDKNEIRILFSNKNFERNARGLPNSETLFLGAAKGLKLGPRHRFGKMITEIRNTYVERFVPTGELPTSDTPVHPSWSVAYADQLEEYLEGYWEYSILHLEGEARDTLASVIDTLLQREELPIGVLGATVARYGDFQDQIGPDAYARLSTFTQEAYHSQDVQAVYEQLRAEEARDRQAEDFKEEKDGKEEEPQESATEPRRPQDGDRPVSRRTGASRLSATTPRTLPMPQQEAGTDRPADPAAPPSAGLEVSPQGLLLDTPSQSATITTSGESHRPSHQEPTTTPRTLPMPQQEAEADRPADPAAPPSAGLEVSPQGLLLDTPSQSATITTSGESHRPSHQEPTTTPRTLPMPQQEAGADRPADPAAPPSAGLEEKDTQVALPNAGASQTASRKGARRGGQQQGRRPTSPNGEQQPRRRKKKKKKKKKKKGASKKRFG